MLLYCLLLIVTCFACEYGNALPPNALLSSDAAVRETPPLASVWSEDFEGMFTLAQKEQKVLVVAFLGQPWCPWSEKLKRDVLNSPDFLEQIQEIAYCAFVNIEEEETEHNRHLRDVFHVRQSPTLIIFDYSQEEIARLHFLPLSAQEYGGQVVQCVQDFEEVICLLKNPSSIASEEKLQKIYENAKKLSSQSYRDQILQIGLKREKGSFFLLEKYAELLETAGFKSPLAHKLRKEIVERDPDNVYGTQLKMAILEFQQLGSKSKGKNRVYKAIAPLIHYVERFGERDPDNLWKVEMMIAQFLFTKNERPMALAHAQASLEAAPESIKDEIRDTVDYLKSCSGLTAW